MKISETTLPEVRIIEPRVFEDPRGYFVETWHQSRYREYGLPAHFVQDNLSCSVRGTLRGLHYQYPHSQGKLIQVLQGEVLDIAVDIRVGSPGFGRWVGVILSSDNRRQLYIPEGFAHGFCVTSESALVSYKCTDFYNPQAEGGVLWNDHELGIKWPTRSPILSPRDAAYRPLSKIPVERLPRYDEGVGEEGRVVGG
jgi:dTDP-4-dehydrorhamnose 3,5-epimerase